jgi:thioredoxin 1
MSVRPRRIELESSRYQERREQEQVDDQQVRLWRREPMASEKVKTFTDNNFDDETSKGVVLVDFWAEWCGPCRRLAPTVDALASEFDGRATVAKLNVDENPNIPGRFAVRGIPTLLLFKEGQLAETIVGLRAKEDIAQMIERHLGA